MDYTAGRSLLELHAELLLRGATLVFTRVTEGLRKDFDRQHLTEKIGEQNIFRSRKLSLAAFRDPSLPSLATHHSQNS
jgi:hypothetical protein